MLFFSRVGIRRLAAIVLIAGLWVFTQATLAAGPMCEGSGDHVQVRHATTLWLHTRPVVGSDLGSTCATQEGRKRHHVDGAQRAN